jgi:hypothetical protein
MSVEKSGQRLLHSMVFGLLAMAAARTMAGAPQPASCQKLVMTGEVSAGQEWNSLIGEGWVFRVLPIQSGNAGPAQAGYSGWDLVVDREPPAGYPDALLVATPPYDSINEREIGTTFGVRAQDAIGWNPRSFRFLTNPAAFRNSQQLYRQLSRVDQASAAGDAPGTSSSGPRAAPALMELVRQSSAGQFRILDARLTPGVADAAPFAENWAVQSAKTPHAFESSPGGKSTPMGMLNWMRFSITLWLPGSWKAPATLPATRVACSE